MRTTEFMRPREAMGIILWRTSPSADYFPAVIVFGFQGLFRVFCHMGTGGKSRLPIFSVQFTCHVKYQVVEALCQLNLRAKCKRITIIN